MQIARWNQSSLNFTASFISSFKLLLEELSAGYVDLLLLLVHIEGSLMSRGLKPKHFNYLLMEIKAFMESREKETTMLF